MAKTRAQAHPHRKRNRTSDSWHERKTAVITGASTGIGREFAELLAQDGFDLVLVARDTERLSSLAKGVEARHGRRTLVLGIDLALPGAAQQLAHACVRRSIEPEILINNAGFGKYGPFTLSSAEQHQEMLQVNVIVPVTLTRLFLPAMLARRRGYVLNVASTAGFQPGPLMANYYATKSYLISLSVALANELKGSGVSVSVLCPGPTRTEFHRRAGMQHTRAASMAFASARTVAAAGYRRMLKRNTVIVPGLLNKIGSIGVRALPLSRAAQIVRRLHR